MGDSNKLNPPKTLVYWDYSSDIEPYLCRAMGINHPDELHRTLGGVRMWTMVLEFFYDCVYNGGCFAWYWRIGKHLDEDVQSDLGTRYGEWFEEFNKFGQALDSLFTTHGTKMSDDEDGLIYSMNIMTSW